jgi:aspartyl-tRNA(Asn)/glutamyl-tRNA(Gln) amidotransferase subunit C
MKIDRIEIQRIAGLARIELTAEEADRFAGELSAIVGYVDQLQQATLPELKLDPAAATPLAEDEPRPSMPSEEVAGNAPRFLHHHFVVPRVIGGEP